MLFGMSVLLFIVTLSKIMTGPSLIMFHIPESAITRRANCAKTGHQYAINRALHQKVFSENSSVKQGAVDRKNLAQGPLMVH
jgi:hypothetical protein